MWIRIITLLLSVIVISGCTPEFKFPDNNIVRNESNPDNPNDTDGDGRDDNDPSPDEDPRVPTYGRHESCLAIYKSNPNLRDGHYYIDHDWDLETAYVNVFCDMTNGGWTEIVGSESNLNLEELQKMCDIKHIKNTLYSDRHKGVGWGLGSVAPDKYCRSCMRCDLFSFVDLKITLSAKAKHENIKDRSKGYLWIPNRRYRNGWQVIEFNDRFTKDSSGSNELYVNTVKEIDRFPIVDIENHQVSAPYNSYGDLTVCMGGKKGFYYNKRYIKNLRVR